MPLNDFIDQCILLSGNIKLKLWWGLRSFSYSSPRPLALFQIIQNVYHTITKLFTVHQTVTIRVLYVIIQTHNQIRHLEIRHKTSHYTVFFMICVFNRASVRLVSSNVIAIAKRHKIQLKTVPRLIHQALGFKLSVFTCHVEC
jgi:hypothetical protein